MLPFIPLFIAGKAVVDLITVATTATIVTAATVATTRVVDKVCDAALDDKDDDSKTSITRGDNQ